MPESSLHGAMVKITLFALASSVGLLSVAAQIQTPPDVTVSRVYEADGVKVEGVGVCDITSQKVSCWNMDGAEDAGLSQRVSNFFLSSYGNEVSFRFGRKNRWLVLRKAMPAGNSGNFQFNGNYASGIQVYDQGTPVLELVRISLESPEKEAAISMSLYGLAGPPAVSLPFKTGEKATYDGVEIQIGASQSVKPAPPGQPFSMGARTGKQWSVVIGLERPAGSQANAPFSFELLGKDSKPIRYVDKNGEPVSDLKVLEESQGNLPGRSYPGSSINAKYSAASFTTGSPSTVAAMTAYTNVDPSRIGALRLSSSRQKNVLITGFPMDPK
jgi:hypothetical protein